MVITIIYIVLNHTQLLHIKVGVTMVDKALVCLKPNDIGIVKEITSCGHACKRLYELGLNRGAKIKVIKNDIGPIILDLSGNKLALGRGLAQKVIIEVN